MLRGAAGNSIVSDAHTELGKLLDVTSQASDGCGADALESISVTALQVDCQVQDAFYSFYIGHAASGMRSNTIRRDVFARQGRMLSTLGWMTSTIASATMLAFFIGKAGSNIQERSAVGLWYKPWSDAVRRSSKCCSKTIVCKTAKRFKFFTWLTSFLAKIYCIESKNPQHNMPSSLEPPQERALTSAAAGQGPYYSFSPPQCHHTTASVGTK